MRGYGSARFLVIVRRGFSLSVFFRFFARFFLLFSRFVAFVVRFFGVVRSGFGAERPSRLLVGVFRRFRVVRFGFALRLDGRKFRSQNAFESPLAFEPVHLVNGEFGKIFVRVDLLGVGVHNRHFFKHFGVLFITFFLFLLCRND